MEEKKANENEELNKFISKVYDETISEINEKLDAGDLDGAGDVAWWLCASFEQAARCLVKASCYHINISKFIIEILSKDKVHSNTVGPEARIEQCLDALFDCLRGAKTTKDELLRLTYNEDNACPDLEEDDELK